MKKILDYLFLKEVDIAKEIFRNLYYSSEISSFAGFDITLLCENKNYDNYDILKEISSTIGERHIEYKYFIKLSNKIYFVRILEDNDNKIYDILMYRADKKEEYDLYDKIFFPKEIEIPQSLANINKPIIYIDNHINILKNEGMFSNFLGYEDWDYKNKCLNKIDISATTDILGLFMNKDFNETITFEKNGGDLVTLNLDFKYLDGFYYIDNIKSVEK